MPEGVDRIVLGQHANSSIGSGLFVSKPEANVMNPEEAYAGNLMFNTSEDHSSLSIIQSGTFNITCSREAISPIGKMIGERAFDKVEKIDLNDFSYGHFAQAIDSSGIRDAYMHTFKENTGRPAALTAIKPKDFSLNATEDGFIYSHDNNLLRSDTQTTQSRSRSHVRQGNYLDKGTHTIAIASPLPEGEIAEVALRFAVGNSSGHFHPWYANTKIKSGSAGGDWSDIDYASGNTQQIVHMDSNWMRLKWGGLGAESYRALHEELSWEKLVKYEMIDSGSGTQISESEAGDIVAEKYGFGDAAEAKLTITRNSKLFSLAITNAQGVVGLVPYTNSTSITVDAYMTPTHAGLRQPVDRTFQLNAGRQKAEGFNAIDDFAHINFPIETHPHTKDLTDDQIYGELHATKFSELPGGAIGEPSQNKVFGDIRDPMAPVIYEDHGKRDMYGWGGHPTEFFVNPFSNGNCTFYTHMQPPHFTDRVHGVNTAIRGTDTQYGSYHSAWVGRYLPIGYEGESKSSLNENWIGGMYPFHTTWGPLWDDQHNHNHVSLNEILWANNYGKVDGTTWPNRVSFNGTGVHWPPGHKSLAGGTLVELADYFDYRDWTGSMGLDGAGSKESLAKEDVWDTFYCSYVVYSTGSVPPRTEKTAPIMIEIDARAKSEGGDMWNEEGPGKKYRNDQGPDGVLSGGAPSEDQRYFNLVFPDDYVEEVGVVGKDPFHAHREPSTGRIYGNVDILFKIPQKHPAEGSDYVKIGSEDYIYDDYVDYQGVVSPNGAFTGKPVPAIVFDFRDTKFAFDNNQGTTLAIENYGYVLGGGGSGGSGTRAVNIDIFGEGGTLSAEFAGGGGGTGGGSGFNETSLAGGVNFGYHRGAGMGGLGWGQNVNFDEDENPYEDLTGDTKGSSGENSTLLSGSTSPRPDYTNVPQGGAGSTVGLGTFITIVVDTTPHTGGEGGDAIGILHDDVLPNIEILNRTPPDITGPAKATYIAAGGGGGGAGHGRIHAEDTTTAGAPGGGIGKHGNAQQGDPTNISRNASYDTSQNNQYEGGLAGYIVGSHTNGGPYMGRVIIKNETDGTRPIVGRHPTDAPVRGSATAGFTVNSGETKEYK